MNILVIFLGGGNRFCSGSIISINTAGVFFEKITISKKGF